MSINLPMLYYILNEYLLSSLELKGSYHRIHKVWKKEALRNEELIIKKNYIQKESI